MSGSSTGYPPEVWDSIRRVWELAPQSMSMQNILEQVAKSLGSPVPSVQVVHRKKAREKWAKRVMERVKKTGGDGAVITTTVTTGNDAKKPKDTKACSQEKKDVQGGDDEGGEVMTLQVITRDERLAKKAKKLGHKVERLVDHEVQRLRDVVGDVTDLLQEVVMGAQVMDLADVPEDAELIFKKTAQMNYLTASAKLVESLAKSHHMVIEEFCLVYAVSPEHFKDGDDEQAEMDELFAEFDTKTEQVMHEITVSKHEMFMRDIAAFERQELSEDEQLLIGHNSHEDDHESDNGNDFE